MRLKTPQELTKQWTAQIAQLEAEAADARQLAALATAQASVLRSARDELVDLLRSGAEAPETTGAPAAPERT